MKLSVSLTEEDVEFLDEFADTHGLPSRSAALHRAIRLLHATRLGEAYAQAWIEWDNSKGAADWEPVVSDGLDR